MTEQEITLVRLAQQGDAAAFGDLVANYDSQVMNLALSLLGSSEDARDVYQEIFIKVFKSLKKYRFQSDFYTYLYRITVNTCLTFRKGRSRRREHFPISIEDNPELMLNKPDMNSTDANSLTLKTELADILKRSVDELPPKQRAVVVLRHYHHKKIREIADIMTLNEGTVKGYLFRAVRTLKEKLEPYYQQGESVNGL